MNSAGRSYSRLLIYGYPFTHKNIQYFALLTARVKEDFAHAHFGRMNDLRLILLQVEGENFREILTEVIPLKECHLASLLARDITDDGKPEIVVYGTWVGGCREWPHLMVITPSQGRWRKIFDGSSNQEPIELKDLNGDGSYEILVKNTVCHSLCHAEMPRWLSIYEYDGRNYSPANSRYPGEFLDLQKQLLLLSQRHPDDAEIFRCIGDAYEILGQRKKAADAHERSERLSRNKPH